MAITVIRAEDSMPDIFVSHAHDDASVITSLAEFLRTSLIIQGSKIRITSAVGHKFRFGENFASLGEEIKACKAFVLFLTPQAQGKANVLMELGAAWILNKPVFPILTRGVSFSALGFESGRHSLSMDDPQFDRDVKTWLKALADAAEADLQDEDLRDQSRDRFVRDLQGVSPALAIQDNRSPRALLRKRILVWASSMRDAQRVPKPNPLAMPDQVKSFMTLLDQARLIDSAVQSEDFDPTVTSGPMGAIGLTNNTVANLIAAAEMLALQLE